MEKGLHLVNWDTITRPRNLGGLGIHRTREANIALLSKRVWDVLHFDEKLPDYATQISQRS